MAGVHVLVVDDERFFREAISEVLQGAGIPHLIADSGSEALTLAEDPRVGVVILDIQLPDMNGIEVFSRLRQARPDVRAIILSAHTDQEYVLEALRLGACDYLAKPLHEEELCLAVNRALEQHELERGFLRARERLRALEGTLSQLWEDHGTRGEAGVPEAAAQAAAELLAATKSSLMLLDEGGSALRVAAVHGRTIPVAEMDPVEVGSGVAGLALERREPVVVEDVTRDERFKDRPEKDRYSTGSFAVVPLTVGDRALGVLCVSDRSEGGAFEEEDALVLRILADQVAHRLASVPKPAGEASEVGEATGEIPLVEEGAADDLDSHLARAVCDAVTAEVEPLRILTAALRPVATLLRAAPVSLYLLADGGLTRETEWDGGLRSDRVKLPLGRGLTGIVAETGQLVATDDPAADPRFDASVDTPEDGEPGPLLCGAVQFRGKTLGVFRAFPEAGEAPSARTGEVLCAALSAAVRNVLLYRSLVESIEEVAKVRRESEAP
jgi:DNA-binding response OmpR family regulator/putative methionine-R-sulfoxide reductase with GAF domain